MDRRIGIAAALLLTTYGRGSLSAAELDAYFPAPRVPYSLVVTTTSPAQQCCRICRKGKACGNSCINVDLQCHQPPGCACDG
jgi:hypothetical protein